MDVKQQVIDAILQSMDMNGRPSTSSKAIELLTECLKSEGLLVGVPTESNYASVDEQVYVLISHDVTRYGKASSNSIGAQRAYNVLNEANLIVKKPHVR